MAQREQWEIEHDARVLRESAEIKNDPTRLAEAQNYLKKDIENSKKALGKNPLSRHYNKATVGHFNFK